MYILYKYIYNIYIYINIIYIYLNNYKCITLIRLYHDYVALRENTTERSGVLEIGARSAPDL